MYVYDNMYDTVLYSRLLDSSTTNNNYDYGTWYSTLR